MAALTRTARIVATTSALALAAGCSDYGTPYGGPEAGAIPARSEFGASTQNNFLVQSGQRSYVIDLAERFNEEVPDTVNFAFNSAVLDPTARQILARQAGFIKQFPEVTFRVFGHTDKVGSAAYNRTLGLRRAQAVVNYFASVGISRARVQAVVTYGETMPLIPTDDRERRNRRTVTEVSGFVQDDPLILNGKYAEVVFREYVQSATEFPPGNDGGLQNLLSAAQGGG
ncbi:OmpA family protein [Maritimibacter sp. DP07]|jgi:outer membrane protein OmpA-like peptidoglycan-associated protein|uniref:OmpA family protein n=1 Tax=Maritimibacter harenae TaxID=2606218 RepID=A0A845LV42_9RHOB|nr:OmpA family protein [Maritimibacter harenae]MZR11750.1 OmpA family protein [Maritimibacter harenae]